MEAGKRNITGIFNRAKKLRIPHFQRSYVWQEEQWERFLDDMKYASHANYPYFMGSVILKQIETPGDQDSVSTIIDGQQRLTTIILFFKALFGKNGTPERFLQIFTTFSDSIILEHNYSDKPIFEKILFDKPLDIREKRSRIYQCYEYFLENIKADEINPNHLLSNISFVGIDLQFQEDEQQIFDTINSLGVRLTTAELLKNYLFNDDVDFYNINWRDIFEKDDDVKGYWEQDVTSGRNIRNNIDLFLQSYLFIKIQEPELNVSSDDKERFFKIDSVFNSYKEFISGNGLSKNTIINELKEYAAVYRSVINPKITEEDVDRNNNAQRLNLVMFGLEITTIIPYVLYVAKKVLSEDERNKMFKYLEAYLMRRLICRRTSKNYNQLFRSLINNGVNSFESLKTTIEMKSDKINNMPTDNAVKLGFAQSELANRQSKGILYFIERTIRNDLNATEMKDFNEYSLEHVMPKKWRNNWNSEGLSGERAEQRDTLVRSLGNLTLITKNLNSSIRDSDWNRKLKGSGKNHGLNEYAQGIEIFSKYMQRSDWNDECIKERGEELSKYAIDDVWKIDSSILNAIDDEDYLKEPGNEPDDDFENEPEDKSGSDNRIYDKEHFISKGYDQKLANKFFEIVDEIEKMVNKNGWNLQKVIRRNGDWIVFKSGRRKFFIVGWDEYKSKFSIDFKVPPAKISEFKKVCPFEVDYTEKWEDADVWYKSGMNISELEKAFEWVYNLYPQKAKVEEGEDKQIYDKDYYISRNYDKNIADKFFDIVNEIEAMIKKNNWNLQTKFNKNYVAFKLGKRQVFIVWWNGKKSFGMSFKMDLDKVPEFLKMYAGKSEWDEHWGGERIADAEGINVPSLENVFKWAYELSSQEHEEFIPDKM